MRGTKLYAMLAAMFMAGAFVASPELMAYAANTVFSTDIVDGQVKTVDLASNAVTAAKIKDGEVKAAEIAANAVGSSEIALDSVGGSELMGVTFLAFGQCKPSNAVATIPANPNSVIFIDCSINGVAPDHSASATLNDGASCFAVVNTEPMSGKVRVNIRNHCSFNHELGTAASIAVIVYDK
jgi:hypothetical protein